MNWKNSRFSERLQYLIDRENFFQADVARGIGVQEARITGWLKGEQKKPYRASIVKLSNFFGCDPNWLQTGEGTPFPTKEKTATIEADGTITLPPGVGAPHAGSRLRQVVQVAVLGKVPAGIAETITEEMVEEYISLPNVPLNSYAVKVSGPSMEPTILDGDYVLYATDRDLRHNDIVVVRDEYGDPVIKRYKIKGEDARLVSDNPKFPTLIPNGDYRVVGVVVKVWRDVKI